MRHIPRWIKLVGLTSLVFEVLAAGALFWRTGASGSRGGNPPSGLPPAGAGKP